MSPFYPMPQAEPEKAGYNQAGRISEVLSILRNTFIGSTMHNNFPGALEACRGTVSIISGKVDIEKIDEMDKMIFKIEEQLPFTEKVYVHDGGSYFQNPILRKKIKRDLEKLWRAIEKAQDEHGYGMFSADDDSGL